MQRRFAPTAFLLLVAVLLPSPGSSQEPSDYVLAWQGGRNPDRYTVHTFGGEVVRDCDMQLSVEGLHPLSSALRDAPGIQTRILFLDCDDDVLLRRYTETRRRHPLAEDRPVPDGIRLERRLLSELDTLAIPEEVLVKRVTVRRRSGYFSNASERDRVRVTMRSWLRVPRPVAGTRLEEAPLTGRSESTYRYTVIDTIGGGASEIQKNIIARRGLGLPTNF